MKKALNGAPCRLCVLNLFLISNLRFLICFEFRISNFGFRIYHLPMPLPILHTSSDTLIRLFHKTENHWTQHLADEVQLACGSAYCNPKLNKVWDANRLLNGSLPEGATPQESFEEVQAYFTQQGSRCYGWEMNPSAPRDRVDGFVAHLEKLGFAHRSHDILYLSHMPTSPIPAVANLKIIPARASYKHAQSLAKESAAEWNEPQLVDAAMMHLDDPHFDALLALREGVAVAMLGVLAVGEIGRIDQVFVSRDFRRQGIGRMMMGRAGVFRPRSLFKHVFLSCDSTNIPAIALYSRLGFNKIGEAVSYYSADPTK